MVLEGRSTRTVRWMGAAVLAASLAGALTGCNSDSGSDADKKPAAGTSATGTQGQGSGGPTSQPADPSASQPSQPRRNSGAGSASAREAVATFVTAIIKGQPKQACLQMAQPAEGSTPAQVGSAARCNGSDPTVQEMQKSLTSLGASFRPKNLAGDPKVVVADIPPAGGKVVVPAHRITVNGQPLDDVVLANSTGVSKGQVDVKLESSKLKGSWWVTNLEVNVG